MYQPNNPPSGNTFGDLIRYLWDELIKIAKAFNQPEVEHLTFKVLAVAPSKPRNGVMYIADASNWDPLTTGGSNPYPVYYNGTSYVSMVPGITSSNSSNAATIDGTGNIIINTAAIATTATDGFLYIPTCAGAPTGTPTSYSGRVPMVYDSTNDKFYIYNGGWKGTTLA